MTLYTPLGLLLFGFLCGAACAFSIMGRKLSKLSLTAPEPLFKEYGPLHKDRPMSALDARRARARKENLHNFLYGRS